MSLDPGGIIAWLIVGLVAGFLAGQLMKGSEYGMVGDIVGIIGAFVGGSSPRPSDSRPRWA